MGYWMIQQICLVYHFWPVGGTRNVHDVLCDVDTKRNRVPDKTVKAFLENKIQ